jgi:hypothetical protein
MSITGAAEAISTSPQNATNFLRSNVLKALHTSGHTPQNPEQIEVVSEEQVEGQTRITAVPTQCPARPTALANRGRFIRIGRGLRRV